MHFHRFPCLIRSSGDRVLKAVAINSQCIVLPSHMYCSAHAHDWNKYTFKRRHSLMFSNLNNLRRTSLELYGHVTFT